MKQIRDLRIRHKQFGKDYSVPDRIATRRTSGVKSWDLSIAGQWLNIGPETDRPRHQLAVPPGSGTGMRECFKGWRRNLGSALLVLACAASSAWIRSISIQDTFTIELNSGSQHRLVSVSQHLVVATITIRVPNSNGSNANYLWTSRRIDYDGWLMTSPEIIPIYFGFHGHSFWSSKQVVDRGPMSVSVTEMHIPYWSIAVPLALLSAWLLLWKPRNNIDSLCPPAAPSKAPGTNALA